MAISWSLENLSVCDLKDYYKNPRRLTAEQYTHLKASIDKFGLIDKPIVNRDGTIIGGHQRVKVLKKDKVKEIECYVPNRSLTNIEIEELNIRLNRNTGEWDFEILANQWELNDLLDWGFTEDELSLEMSSADPVEEDEIPAVGKEAEAITKLGDLYELAGHRLLCGDCNLHDNAIALFNNSTPILMVTDPPFGVNYTPKWREKVGHGKILNAAYMVKDDICDWTEAYKHFPGHVAYVWHPALHAITFWQNLQACDFEIKGQIIWVKQHFALSRGNYNWQHEPCWYAVRKGSNHNWQGSQKESTVWEIANLNAFGKSQHEDERVNHAAQKPLECMARPIRNNTAEGESVYDPFLGSGTTLIAAEQLNRKCFGMELSPSFCDLIVKRWINYRNKIGKEAIVKKNGNITKEFDEKT